MLNVTYGDDFVFAGADGKNVPFEWDGDNLLYRGIDVSLPKALTAEEFDILKRSGGDSEIEGNDTGRTFSDYDDYKTWYIQEFQPTVKLNGETRSASFDQVLARFDEATYVDIGIGMQLNADGNVVPTSAFNSAINGLTIMGTGVDEDGDSKNLAVLMRELGELFQNCDTESEVITEINGLSIKNSATATLAGNA